MRPSWQRLTHALKSWGVCWKPTGNGSLFWNLLTAGCERTNMHVIMPRAMMERQHHVVSWTIICHARKIFWQILEHFLVSNVPRFNPRSRSVANLQQETPAETLPSRCTLRSRWSFSLFSQTWSLYHLPFSTTRVIDGNRASFPKRYLETCNKESTSSRALQVLLLLQRSTKFILTFFVTIWADSKEK